MGLPSFSNKLFFNKAAGKVICATKTSHVMSVHFELKSPIKMILPKYWEGNSLVGISSLV